jgi:hypothetical protein
VSRLTDYAGPTARTTIERASTRDPRRLGVMAKLDGAYARVSIGRDGRISSILSRAGLPIRQLADLIGIVAGPPDSVFHGEVEAFTEAANRTAETRGYRLAHLFDCSRLAGEDMSAAPFSERHGAIYRAHSWVEGEGRARRRDWRLDADGAAHDARTGRYCPAVPRDLRRLPVVPLVRGKGAIESTWREHVELHGGEGIVIAALDAPLGRRLAKVKVRATAELDATCVSVGNRAAMMTWRGIRFVVSAAGTKRPAPNELWSVAISGWHERSTQPRHARLQRRRDDLSPAALAA